jgi:hypothetical protein
MPNRLNLYVDQGIDFVATLNLNGDTGEEFPITDQTFFCDVKKIYSDTTAFSASMEVIAGLPSNDLNLVISGDDTRMLQPGKYQYDVIMVETNQYRTKILEGLLFLLPTITDTSNTASEGGV